MNDSRSDDSIGYVGFLFSLIGLLSLGVVSPLALVVSLLGIFFDRPRSYALAGALLSAIGTILLIVISLAARAKFVSEH